MKIISVVIPAYNEERYIERTVRSIAEYFDEARPEYEIIVSNDGSTDNTPTVVKGMTGANSRIKLINNLHCGKAVTINSGLNHVTGDLCLLMDADGAAHITQLEKLLTILEKSGADIAIGSREGCGSRRISEPLYRHFLGRVFNLLVKVITGLNFEDTQCGFKLFKTDVLKALAARSWIMNKKINDLTDPMVTAFDVELLFLAKKAGYKIVEVPIEWQYFSTNGVNPIRDSIRMLVDIISLTVRG